MISGPSAIKMTKKLLIPLHIKRDSIDKCAFDDIWVTKNSAAQLRKYVIFLPN